MKNIKNLKSLFGYIVLLVTVCTLIILCLANISVALNQIGKVISTLMPFILAFLLAYLLNPFVISIKSLLNKVFFKNKAQRCCKYVSITIVYSIVIGLLTISIIYVAPQISNSIAELINKLPSMSRNSYEYIMGLSEKFPNAITNFISEKVQNIQPDFIGVGTDFLKALFPKIYLVSVSIFGIIYNCIFAVVISCYMISDKSNIKLLAKRAIYAFVPKEKCSKTWKILKECNNIFSGFLVGKTIDSLIIGVMCFILLSIINLPYATLISVIVGVTNMIPYFGPFIGAIPGILIYLIINPRDAIIFALLIFALQQFDGFYLGPKILGDSTGLKPIWVIFAIIVGGAYFGVFGMFLGVPVAAVFAYLINTIIKERLKKRNINEI